MYGYLCVHICACTLVCAHYLCLCAQMCVHTCACTLVCAHLCVHICVCTFVRAHLCVHISVCALACEHLRVQTCVLTCVRAHLCVHTYACTLVFEKRKLYFWWGFFFSVYFWCEFVLLVGSFSMVYLWRVLQVYFRWVLHALEPTRSTRPDAAKVLTHQKYKVARMNPPEVETVP